MGKISIQDFYNIRGRRALEKKQISLGSDQYPEYLKTPYLYVEKVLEDETNNQAKTTRYALELCCGTGLDALRLVQLGYKVEALDVSEFSIKAAKRFSEQLQLSNEVNYRLANVNQALVFPDSHFNLIYISGALYYLDQDSIYYEIRRVIAKHGLFCFIETNGDAFLLSVWRRLKNFFAKHRDHQTLTGLLREKDIIRFKAVFPGAQVRYFDFLTLFGVLFSRTPMLVRFWCKLTRPIDDFLLNGLGLHFLAFKFVIHGRE